MFNRNHYLVEGIPRTFGGLPVVGGDRTCFFLALPSLDPVDKLLNRGEGNVEARRRQALEHAILRRAEAKARGR